MSILGGAKGGVKSPEREESSKTQFTMRRVLAVDDDDFARLTVVRHLEKRGYEVTAVDSVAAAVELLLDRQQTQFDCVVTDYLMPGATGVDLIQWLREHRPTLAAIMVTAIGEKDIVAETLRSGAVNFLEKPVRAPELVAAVESAIELTKRRRELAKTEEEAGEVARIQKRMLGVQAPSGAMAYKLAHFPMRGAGGDFLAVFPLDADRTLVVMADVSGHDLKAAFISAYFQGIVRGMMENRTPVKEVLGYFNRVLIREWSSGENFAEESASLAVCAVEIDRLANRTRVYNHGFPSSYILDSVGRLVLCCPGGGAPLGWFEDAEPEVVEYGADVQSSLVMWTDGLEDQAARLRVSPWALASLLLESKGDERPSYLQDAPDDIMVLRMPLTSEGLPEFDEKIWLNEVYRGDQYKDIDEIQQLWLATLRLALADWPVDRRDQVALCLREAVLNGLRHGCQGSPDRSMTLQLLHHPGLGRLRVRVDDPGEGHDFDWEGFHSACDGDSLETVHRGLVFIHGLANAVESRRRGATLILDFTPQLPDSLR
ncbi:response regulator [Nibricoccus sp. IMCC34717]|uniref:response regulator n=1 Tax=Nibricoccus sp. IMCC34717 TaxID=3034021 RepID=UPI0038508D78